MKYVKISRLKGFGLYKVGTNSSLFNQELHYFIEGDCLIFKARDIDNDDKIVNPYKVKGYEYYQTSLCLGTDLVEPKKYYIDEDSTEDEIIIYLKQ